MHKSGQKRENRFGCQISETDANVKISSDITFLLTKVCESLQFSAFDTFMPLST